MISIRRRLCVALAFFTLLSAPGLPAYCAFGRELDAAQADASPTDWIPALSATSMEIISMPDQASKNTYEILGQIQLDAALHPKSTTALAFIAKLPTQANTPQTLMALAPAERARIISRAITATSAHLSAQAAPILAEMADPNVGLSADEVATLDQLGKLWFYLPLAQATVVRNIALERSKDNVLQRAQRMAQTLIGKMSPVGYVDPEIDAAAKMTFARLRPAVADVTNHPDAVRMILAPQAVWALGQASRSLDERGHPRGALWTVILQNHRRIFGVLADEGMVESLRHRGQWTELVSAISLTAAAQLASEDDAAADDVLRQAGADEDLRLPIPPWHPLAGQFKSVADALSSSYGPPKENLGPGWRFKLFGIPVVVRPEIFALPAVFMIHPMFPLPGATDLTLAVMGIVSVVSIYSSILAHELAHSLTATALGIKVRKIVINLTVGGMSDLEHPRKPGPDFLIEIVGPFMNLALAGLGFLPIILHAALPHFVAIALASFITCNISIALLNLLPALPFDGGRLLQAVLSKIMHDDYLAAHAAEKTAKVTAVICLATTLFLFSIGQSRLAFYAMAGMIGFLPHPLAHPGTTLVEEKPKN